MVSSMNDMDAEHRPLAPATPGSETSAEVGGNPHGCGGEHGIRGGAGHPGADQGHTRADRATQFIETVRGIISYRELAPHLAERVARIEADIFKGEFEGRRIEDNLILDLHAGICRELVPEWGGQWRKIEVRVGNLQPPLPHLVPVMMRDYARDLEARWSDASSTLSEKTVEFLAFAEGRFLTIHPFQDFNGRTVRLFLTELLRRLDLPRVVLAPVDDTARSEYFSSLEAADQKDFSMLVKIWEKRLLSA